MDKNNKYYGVIEEIVRNHRKFPGYETILEDIIMMFMNTLKSL